MMKPPHCQGCPLYEIGQGYAFGEGPKDAKTLILGEALGESEASLSRPFVGGAGRTLNYLMLKADTRRSECFVTNVVRCRPPANRAPLPEEVATCMDRHALKLFVKQFNFVVLLGNVAMQALMEQTQITKWRGSVVLIDGVKMMPTFHPAYIMRQQDMIPIMILDLKKISQESWTAEYMEPLQNYQYNAAPVDLDPIMKSTAPVSVDVETNSLDAYDGSLTRVGVSCVPGTVYVVKDLVTAKSALSALLSDMSREKVGHNIFFDIKQLRANGIEINPPFFDTMVAHHLVIGEVPSDLAFVSSIYTRIPYWKHLIKQDLDLYNATDVDATLRISESLRYEISRLGLGRVFKDTMDVLPVLQRMSAAGVLVDRLLQAKWRVGLERRIKSLETVLSLEVGDKLFNWRSHTQLTKLLYEKLKLPKQFNKHTDHVSANEEALIDLKAVTNNKIVDLLLQLRKFSKLASTYFSLEDTPDHKVHTDFLVHVTPTGRLASRNPNLQNVPKGPARAIYVPAPGNIFVSADYSQIEMRISAVLAGEQALLDAFAKGEDIHRKTAALVYHVMQNEVTDQQRFKAKMMVYGMGYGRGARSIAKEHKMSLAEAERFIDEYFVQFPRIKFWRQTVANEGQRNGFLVNPYGHRRYFFGPNTVPKMYNYLPQSTAAYVIMEAMLKVDEQLPKGAHLILQVHDSLVVECEEGLKHQVIECLTENMQAPIDVLNGYQIPVKVGIGKNWSETD
jgi:DNA polymerase-1